jgi:hypothetical protein
MRILRRKLAVPGCKYDLAKKARSQNDNAFRTRFLPESPVSFILIPPVSFLSSLYQLCKEPSAPHVGDSWQAKCAGISIASLNYLM